MKLTREQVEHLKMVRDCAISRKTIDALSAVLAACEVEEVDPVVEDEAVEAARYFTQRNGVGILELMIGFHRHMRAKELTKQMSDWGVVREALCLLPDATTREVVEAIRRLTPPAFDEGRAREIANDAHVVLQGYCPTEGWQADIVLGSIRRYVCGSSGSDGGNVTTHSARRMAQAVGFDTESGGRGAGSSGTEKGPSNKSGTKDQAGASPTSSSPSEAPASAPAAGVGCRWESAEEFVGPEPGCKKTAWCIEMVAARDAAWVERLVRGELSYEACRREAGHSSTSPPVIYREWLVGKLSK